MAISESCCLSRAGGVVTIRGFAIVISVTVCASAVVICQYFISSKYMNHLLRQSESLQAQVKCFDEVQTTTMKRECWEKYGIKSSTYKNHNMSAECLEDENVKKYIKQKIDANLQDEKEHLEKEVGEVGQRNLERMVERVYGDDGRFVVHWIAYDNAGVGMQAHKWFPVTNLSSDGSIYTVSPGYKDTFVNGSVKIPKDGVYMIYGKITPKCERPDKKPKRVYFEVRVRLYDDSEKTLLSEVARGVCNMEGDLLTMFQQGLLRLTKENLVYMRVKFPDNVKLSDEDSWFKNNIGVSWIGPG